ncbi:hypothetical protein GCM10009560_75720 [Nonomuraea longicatena]|uniref:Integrase n=1 Tax=Nonomuraea longicatena TaxID=83682 RepID=A0ABN1R8U7_9ACTN
MAEPVRARRSTDAEGQALQIRVRRALIIMASASGTTPARHPDVLAEQRRERTRVRSEKQRRWGRPRT